VLYVGTDFGVFVSTNGGARWEVLGGNLPSVQVSDLQISARDNIIVISTYGRGCGCLMRRKCPRRMNANERAKRASRANERAERASRAT
jgi:ligand-binding sensor domain-containing protein